MSSLKIGHALPASNTKSPAHLTCRLCRCKLVSSDNLDLQVCLDCNGRPEARRLGPPAMSQEGNAAPARELTELDLLLIRQLCPTVGRTKLLDILNERLRADLGPDAQPYSMAQLEPHLSSVAITGAADFAALRMTLARARRTGLLDRITPQLIDDFAAVFMLAPGQVVQVKDAILDLQAPDEDEASIGLHPERRAA